MADCDGGIPPVIVFGEPMKEGGDVKSLDAVVDTDKFGDIYGVEVLWLKDQLGGPVADSLLERLAGEEIAFQYDPEVDILHFSLRRNVKSISKKKWLIEVHLDGDDLNAVCLKLA